MTGLRQIGARHPETNSNAHAGAGEKSGVHLGAPPHLRADVRATRKRPVPTSLGAGHGASPDKAPHAPRIHVALEARARFSGSGAAAPLIAEPQLPTWIPKYQPAACVCAQEASLSQREDVGLDGHGDVLERVVAKASGGRRRPTTSTPGLREDLRAHDQSGDLCLFIGIEPFQKVSSVKLSVG